MGRRVWRLPVPGGQGGRRTARKPQPHARAQCRIVRASAGRCAGRPGTAGSGHGGTFAVPATQFAQHQRSGDAAARLAQDGHVAEFSAQLAVRSLRLGRNGRERRSTGATNVSVRLGHTTTVGVARAVRLGRHLHPARAGRRLPDPRPAAGAYLDRARPGGTRPPAAPVACRWRGGEQLGVLAWVEHRPRTGAWSAGAVASGGCGSRVPPRGDVSVRVVTGWWADTRSRCAPRRPPGGGGSRGSPDRGRPPPRDRPAARPRRVSRRRQPTDR